MVEDIKLQTHRLIVKTNRGVRFSKYDFGSVFGSVLEKNRGFRFGFQFS